MTDFLADVVVWVPMVTGVLAAMTPVVVGYFGWKLGQANKEREERHALAGVHRDLTSGEVANARDIVARTILSKSETIDPNTKGESIKAYFALLWCVERVDNTFQIYAKPDVVSRARKRSGPPLEAKEHGLSKVDSLIWNLNEVIDEILGFRSQFKVSFDIQDDDAWESFKKRLKSNASFLCRNYDADLTKACSSSQTRGEDWTPILVD
jgi:hypothetical protein